MNGQKCVETVTKVFKLLIQFVKVSLCGIGSTGDTNHYGPLQHPQASQFLAIHEL